MARKSMMGGDAVLVLNSGSSSLKFGVFAEANGDVRGALSRRLPRALATGQGKIWLRGGDGKQLLEETQVFPGQPDVRPSGGEEIVQDSAPEVRRDRASRWCTAGRR